MAHVEAICISARKGQVKREQPQVLLKADWGMENDAHAGAWHRQISLLAGESIDNVKKVLPSLKHGAFAENIITRGLDLTALKIGDRLQIGGEAIVEITQIGKQCHNDGCVIKKATGDCIMPREGLFARVIRGGQVRKGDSLTVVPAPAP
jgi:MOSC domain-containing protein YiiM